jgi:hypothetical protein
MKPSNLFREQKPIIRQGIQALYTFTPFKLLRAKPEEYYTLILAPVTSFEVAPPLRWRSTSCKASFKVPISAQGSKRVVQPHQLYPLTFRKGSKDSYIYKRKGIEEEKFWSYPPTYMEFSWSALNSGYYCRLGWTLLSSQPRCPQEKHCPNLRGSPCEYYSKRPISYPSLFNVYPRIQRKFEDPVGGFTFLPILAIRYKDKPLAILRFTDRGSFIAFVDGIVFSPKLAWMFVQPMIFIQEGLGFEICNVHAIELEFLPEVLEEFIKDILSSNNDIARWVILKYRLYMEDSAKYDFVREKRGFKAFERLDKIVKQVVQGMRQDELTIRIVKDVQGGNISPELVSFACILFLHSLAHILKNILVAKYGCGTEDVSYYIEHPRLRVLGAPSGKTRVVLFETAMGGFGYIKNFVEEIQKTSKTDVFEELIYAAIIGFRKSCEEKVEKSLNNLEKELKSFQDSYKKLVNLILKAYHDSFPNTAVYPHVNSIRKAIAEAIPELPEEERSLLDDLLAKGPHCWDGCQLCVMMERGCNFLPFDQPFLVSEKLLKAALEIILTMIRQPENFSPLKKGVRKEFESLLSAARSKIDLISPWISPEVVEYLFRLYLERHLKVRIITKIDLDNETQVQSIERLTKILRNYSPNFQAKVINELHAKGMLIDDIMLFYGSFNFTISGLSTNVENVTVDFSLLETKKFKEEFNELWSKAEPLA